MILSVPYKAEGGALVASDSIFVVSPVAVAVIVLFLHCNGANRLNRDNCCNRWNHCNRWNRDKIHSHYTHYTHYNSGKS